MVFATSTGHIFSTAQAVLLVFQQQVFYKQKAWRSLLAEFRCSSVKITWYSGSRCVTDNTGGIISDFSLSFMRSINIVASGVE